MLAELVLAAAIVMLLLGSVFSLVDPTRGALAVQPHAADTQQRLRAAFVRLQTDLVLAGSGPHPTLDVSVARLRAPVVPALVGQRHPPAAGATFAADAVTILYAPPRSPAAPLASPLAGPAADVQLGPGPARCRAGATTCAFEAGSLALVFDGAGRSDIVRVTRVLDDALRVRPIAGGSAQAFAAGASIVPLELRAYYHDRAAAQLRYQDGWVTDVPVLDDVVGLTLRYFGAGALPGRKRRRRPGGGLPAGRAGGLPPGAGRRRPRAGAGAVPVPRRAALRRAAAVRHRPVPDPARAGRDPPAGVRRVAARARPVPVRAARSGARRPAPGARSDRRLRRGAQGPVMGSTRGIALVVTLLALLVLVALTGALIPLTSSETAISAHHRRAAQTLYAAEAALEWVLQELQPVDSWDALLAGSRRSALWAGPTTQRLAGGATLDLGRMTVELQRRGAGASGAGRGLRWRLHAHGPLSAILPREPSLGLLRVAVWLADDPAETDDDPARDTNGVVLLHAAGVGPSLAQRAVQATLRRSDAADRVTLASWTLVR